MTELAGVVPAPAPKRAVLAEGEGEVLFPRADDLFDVIQNVHGRFHGAVGPPHAEHTAVVASPDPQAAVREDREVRRTAADIVGHGKRAGLFCGFGAELIKIEPELRVGRPLHSIGSLFIHGEILDLLRSQKPLDRAAGNVVHVQSEAAQPFDLLHDRALHVFVADRGHALVRQAVSFLLLLRGIGPPVSVLKHLLVVLVARVDEVIKQLQVFRGLHRFAVNDLPIPEVPGT